MNKIYLIKNLSNWMLDELIAFSGQTKFKVIFLRTQSEFYDEGIKTLRNNGIEILIKPFKFNFFFKKLFFIILFFFKNIWKFIWGYSSIIGLKSLYWFLKMNLSQFEKPLSLHAQFATQASILAFMLKEFYKEDVEYYFTFHAYDIYFNNKWFSKLVNESKNALSISDYNIKYVKENYININADKIKLSRLGAFQPVIKNKEKDKKIFTIGLMSWFEEKKGIIYLLKAMKQISRGNKDINLILAGDGPLKQDILTYIENNNLGNIIKYMGKIKGRRKVDFLKSLDAFILPAISLPNNQDGIPVVLMEAISYGLPLISTNISGIPEICINEYNGYLIKEKEVKPIIYSINKLKKDKSLRIKFSENSLELSKKYDIDINSKNKVNMLGWC